MAYLASCDYLRIEPVYVFSNLCLDDLLYSSFSLSAPDFFTSLFSFCHVKHLHGKSRGCIQIDVLLPEDCSSDDFKDIGCTFMREFMPDLPYCFFSYKAGIATYLRFYVSERRYKKNGFVDEKICKHDMYVNHLGRMCKSTDDGARLIKKKGCVVSSVSCDWSVKTHKFMTNGSKFAELVQEMKDIFTDIFRRYQCHSMKHVKLTKIDRRKAHNRFQQRNVTKINNCISRCELILNELSRRLKAGYFYDYYEKDFHRLRNRYKTIIKNTEFKQGRVTLRFSMNTRWDILDDTLDSLVDKLNNDVNEVYASLSD